MSVLNKMDWFETLEETVPDNKIVDIGDEIEDDIGLDDFGFNSRGFSEDTFSIGVDW